ncbi:Very-long-chain 3-oxoacyl-CoA synthase [Bertholletia excelsa]
MASIPQLISSFPELLCSTSFFHILMVAIAASAILLYLLDKRTVAIYLLDFTCYRPPYSHRLPMPVFLEQVLHNHLDPEAIAFQIKVLESSGYGEETCVPRSLKELPIKKSLEFSREEAETVMFSTVKDLLEKNKLNPKAIDVVIANSSMFSPTPSLTAMVANKFGMRSNVMSFNLSGMGCSAGLISIALARDLLRVHRNSLALIVSIETLNYGWYSGKERSILLSNCLFRMGGAAVLLSSWKKDKKMAKYELKHLVRTNRAQDNQSYACVYQDPDKENITGVSISKSILNVASEALMIHMASLGPQVLPLAEQLRYVSSLIWQKSGVSGRGRIYTPDFTRAFDHFCVHAGGKAVILAIGKALNLREEDMEASKMTLHRFGNTSCSSIWYELSYMEAKGRMKRGNRAWQLAFGSGFKCNSVVWECLDTIGSEINNAWSDKIHSYPTDLPDIYKMNNT